MAYREQCYKGKEAIKGVYERRSETKTFKGKPDLCFDISYKKDGKKIWEKIGWLSEGYSAKLAEQVRAERIRSIRHGEELPKQKKKAPAITFAEIGEKYVKWSKDNKKSAKDDASRYANHLLPEFGAKRLDEISPLDIEKFKSRIAKGGRVARTYDGGRKALQEPGLSPQTVKHCLALLRQIYNKAAAWGLYTGLSPVKDVQLPRVRNSRERFLSYQEAELLLKELKAVSPIVHDISVLSLHCGLRAGEIFNLQGQDIDLSRGIIRIIDPKNGENRAAFMTGAVKEILATRMPESPADHVFKDRLHGGKIEGVSHTFKKVVTRSGLNDGVIDRRQRICFHTLRHSHASWLALQGESLLTIAESLGHKGLDMVRRYSHLIPDEKRKASLKLEANFEAGTKKEQVT